MSNEAAMKLRNSSWKEHNDYESPEYDLVCAITESAVEEYRESVEQYKEYRRKGYKVTSRWLQNNILNINYLRHFLIEGLGSYPLKDILGEAVLETIDRSMDFDPKDRDDLFYKTVEYINEDVVNKYTHDVWSFGTINVFRPNCKNHRKLINNILVLRDHFSLYYGDVMDVSGKERLFEIDKAMHFDRNGDFKRCLIAVNDWFKLAYKRALSSYWNAEKNHKSFYFKKDMLFKVNKIRNWFLSGFADVKSGIPEGKDILASYDKEFGVDLNLKCNHGFLI